MTQAIRIKITDVSKIYQSETKTVEAVKNFSESVKDGEFVCVVGASGCGKTTLLWCLSGLHPVTLGTVHIDGELLTKEEVLDNLSHLCVVDDVWEVTDEGEYGVFLNCIEGAWKGESSDGWFNDDDMLNKNVFEFLD